MFQQEDAVAMVTSVHSDLLIWRRMKDGWMNVSMNSLLFLHAANTICQTLWSKLLLCEMSGLEEQVVLFTYHICEICVWFMLVWQLACTFIWEVGEDVSMSLMITSWCAGIFGLGLTIASYIYYEDLFILSLCRSARLWWWCVVCDDVMITTPGKISTIF